MNTPTTKTLQPERWLLAASSVKLIDRLQAGVSNAAQRAVTPSFAAWRVQHGLVRCMSAESLASEIRSALDEACPAVHVHAWLPQDSLARAWAGAGLQGGEERLVDCHLWTDASQGVPAKIEDELARPDAWVELAWRLNNGGAFPVLAADGTPESAASYRQAFVAWRKSRFELGDSGVSPYADEDGNLPPLADDDSGADGDDDDVASMRDDDGTPAPGTGPSIGSPVPTPRRRRTLPGMMAAAAAEGAAAEIDQWFEICHWSGRASTPDGRPGCDVTVRVQGTRLAATAPLRKVRVVLEWPSMVARNVPRDRVRVVLLPRLQSPVLLTFQNGATKLDVPTSLVPLATMKQWVDTLPGTPMTVILMPAD